MDQDEKKIKVDVSSKIGEQVVDIAKNFVDSLIMPAIEETGLLIKDKVTLWRFNNQIKMLNKAKQICEKNNIDPKTISLKLLCPLLDYAGLEEDDYLQDKWAHLLANMVDSEQNIDNHVFPYLLSQISTTEFTFLENAILKKNETIDALNLELSEWQEEKQRQLRELTKKIAAVKLELETTRAQPGNPRTSTYLLTHAIQQHEHEKYVLNHRDKRESDLKYKLYREQFLSTSTVEEYELANMVRLGVIKAIQVPYAEAKSLSIPNDPNAEYLHAEIEIDIAADEEDYSLTELGNLFIGACNQKASKSVETVN